MSNNKNMQTTSSNDHHFLKTKIKGIPGRAHRLQISATSAVVYGAQHPPSLKPIQNYTTKLIKSKNSNNYKEFEKNTDDDWNLNNSDDDGGGSVGGGFDDIDEDFNDLPHNLPISIEQSNQVAKQIIKDHSEKMQKQQQQQQQQDQLTRKQSLKTAASGPGKALRQQDEPNERDEAAAAINLATNTLNSVKIRNDSLSSASSVYNESKQQIISNNNNKPSNPQIASSTNLLISSSTTYPRYSPTPQYLTADNIDQAKLEKFKRILNENPINLEELQKACWKGIPRAYRPICWKLLSDYLPLNVDLQQNTIEQKRNTYWNWVNEHYSKTYLDAHQDTLRQILNDLPRMNPLMPIFQKKSVQDIFQRILYVWSVRHPASGYVQGINDLVTPFFAVFLTEYLDANAQTNGSKNNELDNLDIQLLNEEQLRNLEADCYGCLTKLLDRIQENYVFSQPGIQRKVVALEELIKRMDVNLHRHLKKNNIEFLQFAFRWMNNLLMREMPLQCTIRLWDTYHAEPFGFSDFHLYVCAAFLLRFSKDLLRQKDFQDLMLYLQNLPTRTWNSNDIQVLTAEAYKLQVMFANAPKHIEAVNNNESNS